MSRIELVAPCHFGLEAVLKKEIVDLGYEIVQVEDGKVIFAGDEAAVCRANIFLRTAERVLPGHVCVFSFSDSPLSGEPRLLTIHIPHLR